MPAPARSLAFYQEMDDAVKGPMAHLLLARPIITGHHLDLLRRIARDPVLVAVRNSVFADVRHLDSLEAALDFLRHTGLARDVEAMPSGSGWRAIARRVEADLDRAEAPAAPFAIPAGWRQLRTLRDVRALGALLANCASGYESPCILRPWFSGTAVFLAAEGDRAGLATVHTCGDGAWWLGEIHMEPRGTHVPNPVTAMLSAALSLAMVSVGHRLLHCDPIVAIRTLMLAGEHPQISPGNWLAE